MLIILSPAKTFDFETPATTERSSEPYFVAESTRLGKKMSTFSRKKLEELMDISPELAALNVERFKEWTPEPTAGKSKQAILTFNGEVFRGLNAKDMSEAELLYAQEHLRILSGLYGLLRPLDLIQPHRLEMGTRLKYYSYHNLYQFWGDKITKRLNEELHDADCIINLASSEYYKSVHEPKLDKKVITPIFKDFSNGTYKVLMTYAKNARGVMAGYIIRDRLTEAEAIKGFQGNGYAYDAVESDAYNWVFKRG